jgi:hypothetical protein
MPETSIMGMEVKDLEEAEAGRILRVMPCCIRRTPGSVVVAVLVAMMAAD